MIQWPAIWDLTSTVAVPANTSAQRLGLGATCCGNSESWWDDPKSSDDWGHRDGGGTFRFPPTPNPVHAPQKPVTPKPAGGIKVPVPKSLPEEHQVITLRIILTIRAILPAPSPKPGDVDTGEVQYSKQLPELFL